MFQHIRKGLIYVSLFVVLAFFTGCGGSDSASSTQRGELLASSKVLSLTSPFVKATLDQMGIPYGDVVFGYDAYKIAYRTIDEQGNAITASGLLTVPQSFPIPMALVSDQHGTIFSSDEAPSNNPTNKIAIMFSALSGFTTAMPDYVGFGYNKNQTHPYVLKKSLASATVDMIQASKQFCEENDISLSEKLFLSGYSEGGYATMAALEEIEKNYTGTINITATSAMAGPYDVKATADAILGQNMLLYPPFTGFIAYSYQQAYKTDSLSDIFSAPYAEKIPSLFNGTKTGNEIYPELTTVTNELFTQTFLDGYLGDGEQELKDALEENSVYNWTPSTMLKLIHCDNDMIVPFTNSQTAYDTFMANGSSSVELITLNGSDHAGCAEPAYMQTLGLFLALR